MKKLYSFLAAALLLGPAAFSQCSVTVSGSTDVTCFGGCDGSAQVTTIGLPNFSYSWAPGGQTIQNPTDLCAGTHTVTMTDANSCVATATVTITQPGDIQVVAGVTNVTCNGACDGAVTTAVNGGTPPYSYDWSPGGETTSTLSSQCAGTYTLTLTDDNGCMDSLVVTITEPAVLTNAISVTNVTCNGACDGVATATPSGGTAPYTFAWSPGGQNTNLCAGTYTVTITDMNGCMVTDSATITQPTALQASISVNNVSCNGTCDGSATVLGTGGTPPYTYMWSPGGQTNPTVTNLCAGTYTVTIVDGNGCMQTVTLTVTQPGPMMVTATGNDASAPGMTDGSASVSASGGLGGYTYDWSSGQTTPSISGIGAGSYEICVTDSVGCTACDTVVILDGTGFIDLEEVYGISIYPSPATTVINVSSKSAAAINLSLRDITGKLILAERYTSTPGTARMLDIAAREAGVYFLELEIEGARMVRKIVKQ